MWFSFIYLNYSCRIQQDSYDMDDLAVFGSVENESGYSSRVEADYYGDLKTSFIKEKMNVSADKSEQACLDQFCLFRRKRKPSIEGEDKFNKLSDEIILMILKWLPKKCLVRKYFYNLKNYTYAICLIHTCTYVSLFIHILFTRRYALCLYANVGVR